MYDELRQGKVTENQKIIYREYLINNKPPFPVIEKGGLLLNELVSVCYPLPANNALHIAQLAYTCRIAGKEIHVIFYPFG